MRRLLCHPALLLLAAAALALPAAVSCSGGAEGRLAIAYAAATAPESVPGASFVRVEASAFPFNETPQGRLVDGAKEPFFALQSPFWITSEPVSAGLYERYMGKYPRNGISYDDAQALLDRIYLETGLPVILPTESMFEAALRAGIIHPENRYRYLVDDAESERRIDGGPVRSDWKGTDGTTYVVSRTATERIAIEHYRSRSSNRLYIAMQTRDSIPDRLVSAFNPASKDSAGPETGSPLHTTVNRLKFTVNEATFDLVPVSGGTMTLGATPEQGKYAEEDEAPLREVTLEDFCIAKTEVTAAQWAAVMGYYPPGNYKGFPDRPVTNVSWFDAQRFVLKLSEMTGFRFRLPSEDEWEYAARGGRRSEGYIFSGSNNARDVAVCTYKNKKGESVRPEPADVGSRKPNELGLYDMSGGAWEWVRGTYTDGRCIQRGGSRLSINTACRVSNRQAMEPGAKKDTFGFRIAM